MNQLLDLGIYERKVTMSEDLVIRHCAPTLAGIKTGNLFSCSCRTEGADESSVPLKQKLVPRGIRIVPLRVRKGHALIYAYRPHALESDLANDHARELLTQYGYLPGNLNACVIHLMRRLQSAGEFPIDRPLFKLSSGGRPGLHPQQSLNFKCSGCWKVYGDEQAAKSIFEKYNVCSKIYFQQWQQGKSIEQLT